MRTWLVAGLGALLLCSCAHAPDSARRGGFQGTWEVASLRARLGARLLELAPSETTAAGQDGQQHRYAAAGTLLLAHDGTCRLLLDVRVDGAPGRSERDCTWRGEGARLTLQDQTGAVTVYRAALQGGGLLLEAVAPLAPDAGDDLDVEEATGERMLLLPASQPEVPAVAALPEPPRTEGGEPGDR